MTGRLFYAVAVSFASGIFARSFFDIDPLFLCTLAVAACALAIFGYAKRFGVYTPLFLLSFALLSFSLGALRLEVASFHKETVLDAYVGERVTVEGYVLREVDVRERTAHVTVRAERVGDDAVSGNILLVTDRLAAVSYGDAVRVEGVLQKPESFETDLGRTFDYPGYLSVRGIYHTMSFADIETLAGARGNPVVYALFSFERAFMRSLESVIPEPQAGLGEGLLLGVKRALGEDLESAFRATGIIHIVVLSGYNITIVAEAVMRLLAAFFMPRTRFAIGVGAIIAFAVLVGLSATVVRASIMALLVLVARVTGKTYAVMRALVLSGLLMLLINPLLLVYDPGFQLSFLATFGLIMLAPIIESWLRLVPTRFQVREFVTATVATQIFVLPLLLYSIGELSLVALPTNVLVLVVVPLAMLLTFLAGAVGFVSATLALPFSYAAYLVLGYIIGVVEWLAALPYASVVVPSFPFWIVCIAYLFLGALIFLLHTPNRRTPATT